MKILFEIWNCYTLNSIRGEAGKYEVISDIGIFVVKLSRGWGPATAVSENLSLRGIVTNFVSGSQTLLTSLIRTIWTLNNIHSTDKFKYNTRRCNWASPRNKMKWNIGKHYMRLNNALCVALHDIHTHDGQTEDEEGRAPVITWLSQSELSDSGTIISPLRKSSSYL